MTTSNTRAYLEGSRRFVTVVTSDTPCGKRSRIVGEELEVKSLGFVVTGRARIVRVDTPTELLELLTSLTEHQYVTPDFVPKLLDIESFAIVAQSDHEGRFPDTAGQPQRDPSGDYLVSLNDNPEVWHFGSWRILDRDVDPLTPEQYRCSFDDWLEHADRLLPGVKLAPKVYWPSSKTRVRLIGDAAASSLNSHLWVDCSATANLDCNAFRDRMKLRSVIRGMAWETPRTSRQTGERLTGKGTHRTVFDLSVWTIHRIIYAGPPTLAPGIELVPAAGWSEEGVPIDLAAALPTIRPAELDEFKRITRLDAEVQVHNGQQRLVINDGDTMKPDSEVELADGNAMSISQFQSDARYSTDTKYRCQTMFRESSSMNGILRKFDDGRVMHHDNGTGVTYWFGQGAYLLTQCREPNIMSFDEFMGMTPEFNYIWRGILMKGWLYALVASPGSGKTAVALYLSVMAALGRSVAGRETHPSRVLYLCGENPQDVRMRMEMMLLHYGIDLWELHDSIYFTRRPFAIDEVTQLAQFIEDVEAHGPFDLCIIDTGPAHSQADDENDNREMHKLAMAMRELMAPIGTPCTIALMHPGKTPTKDQLLPRGGSSFTGSIDGVLCLWRDSKDKPSEMFAHQQKYRHEHFNPLFFDLRRLEHPTIKDNFGYPVCSVVAELGVESSGRKDRC